MTELIEERDVYLSDFARLEKGAAPGGSDLAELRQAAIDRFAELGFPTLRDEEWRFTSLAPLSRIAFRTPDGGAKRTGSKRAIELPFADTDMQRLVFVNGRFAPEQSALSSGPVVLGSLAEALRHQPQRVLPHLGQYARYEDHAFIALNTAFLRDGAFIHVPEGQIVSTPIHLIFVSEPGAEPTVCHPRTLVVVGRAAQVALVESYIGPEGLAYFTNPVTEIAVGEGASVDHYKLQQEGRGAFHVATLQVQQHRSSTFSSHFLSFGGGLVRNEVNAVLGAEGVECTLNGLYLGSQAQHVDNHTFIEHAMPHGASHELYKGILKDRAHGVFNGKIFVGQDAQKTDAKQTNQTLLLSADATINTKPQLEIYADDVKCTHGATVGQLAEEAIFYLRSRGVGEAEARALLTYAFANDIVGRVRIEPLRAHLEHLLLAAQGLPAGTLPEEAE